MFVRVLLYLAVVMCKSTFDEEDQGEEPREEKCLELKEEKKILF